MSIRELMYPLYFQGEICDIVGSNVVEYPVSSCCTGKYGYKVCAFNEYEENCCPYCEPCNIPDCQPKLNCEKTSNQVPSLSQWGIITLIALMIVTTVFIMSRKHQILRGS